MGAICYSTINEVIPMIQSNILKHLNKKRGLIYTSYRCFHTYLNTYYHTFNTNLGLSIPCNFLYRYSTYNLNFRSFIVGSEPQGR